MQDNNYAIHTSWREPGALSLDEDWDNCSGKSVRYREELYYALVAPNLRLCSFVPLVPLICQPLPVLGRVWKGKGKRRDRSHFAWYPVASNLHLCSLPMYVSLCLSVCLSPSFYLLLRSSVSTIWLCLSACSFVQVCVYRLHVWPSVLLSFKPLPICLCVRLPACLSLCLFLFCVPE